MAETGDPRIQNPRIIYGVQTWHCPAFDSYLTLQGCTRNREIAGIVPKRTLAKGTMRKSRKAPMAKVISPLTEALVAVRKEFCTACPGITALRGSCTPPVSVGGCPAEQPAAPARRCRAGLHELKEGNLRAKGRGCLACAREYDRRRGNDRAGKSQRKSA